MLYGCINAVQTAYLFGHAYLQRISFSRGLASAARSSTTRVLQTMQGAPSEIDVQTTKSSDYMHSCTRKHALQGIGLSL
jgi:hypothetical protein